MATKEVTVNKHSVKIVDAVVIKLKNKLTKPSQSLNKNVGSANDKSVLLETILDFLEVIVMIKLSKDEKFEIEYWERMDHPENGNGYVVVIYDSPDESRNSVAFANVYSGAELEKAWQEFCGDDPEIGIIKSVMWCAGVISK